MAHLPFTVWEEWRFSSRIKEQLSSFASLCVSNHGNGNKQVNSERIRKDQVDEAPEVILDIPENKYLKDSPVVNDTDRNNDEELEENSFVGSVDTQSQQCIGSSSSRLVDCLRNGPLPYEQLCEFSTRDISTEIQGASDVIILNFCQSLCSGSSENHAKFVRILCHNLLLPKVRESNCTFTRPLMAAIQLAIEKFPTQSCSTLLAPLIITPGSNISNVETMLSRLSDSSKQVTLKCVLERGVRSLKEEQVTYLLKLLSPTPLESSVRAQLIDLVCLSANNLCTSTPFGRFLVSVIKQVGPSCDAVQRDRLGEVVKQHKSLQRRLAEQALQSLT